MIRQGLLLLLLVLGGGSTDSSRTLHGAAAGESNGAFQRCKGLEPDPSSWNGFVKDCTTCYQKYHIWQPCHLTARTKGSVTLPCTFNYTWKAQETAQVYWRLGNFHGEFLFNHTHDPTHWDTHPNYTGRVSLVGDLSKGLDASIQIENLRESDSNLYFCSVSIQTLHEGVKYWRNIEGTNLTVAGPPVPDPPNFNLVGLATGGAVAAVAVALGLLAFVAWRKGCCPKCAPRRRASPQSKETPEEREYEEFPIEGPKAPPPASPQPPPRAPPPLAPKDSGGLLYADLNLVGGRGKKKMSEGGRGEESTYAILRH
ncbi:paired immunoglobulin-like type 2 receptor alpha [Podarcis raffonei]|uniref:paired immunoglobulin-like type 2 receptor alpha n=1 Tax=Podarcis raffonei TaxID=65483 RepID=UPI002329663A|nr:paired immunoglobulin-like type 2 receptor alpha [Podarcis raffonei]